MAETYITRSLEPILEKAFVEFPVVVLIGPRQSGKTTLLKHLFSSRARLVSLEPPDVREAAIRDPRGFMALYPPPVIFDEIQYAPNLLPYIKEQVDNDRNRSGQYILTGSQNLLLMQHVTESLAGRTAILKLLPMSKREVQHTPNLPLAWESNQHAPIASTQTMNSSSPGMWDAILRGDYPELISQPDRDARLWHASYIQTYLERDVRNLRNIGDLTLFQTYLRALASRSAQLLNLSQLARDVGISVSTAKDWLSILEASFQVFILRPYFVNIGKRLIKSPKVYFMDTGLLCYLVGLRDREHAADGPMGGAIFENLVACEIYKTLIHRGEEPAMYFWRTAEGVEVDLILEIQSKLLPIEIKLSSTPRSEMANSIRNLQKYFGERVLPGYVVNPGNIVLPLGGEIIALPFVLL
jgi:predicted AAA+ superfamily ATPase